MEKQCAYNWIVLFSMLLTFFYVAMPSMVLADSKSAEATQQREIQGVVFDSRDAPIPGVTVTEKGSANSVKTNESGQFTIRVPDLDATLIVHHVGYQESEVPVTGSSLTIRMIESNTSLDEVVIVGFGTQKKENLTGAVTQISGEQIQERMAPSVTWALQGVIPNLNITNNASGGEPGSTPNINIRGTGSLSGSSPFILIDGVPGELANVNPNDIESISVLKDASASAIYGARAAFGVIMVTTRKGTVDAAPKISYNTQLALQSPTVLPKWVSSLEWATTVNEAYKNGGQGQYYSDELIELMRYNIANPGELPLTVPSAADPNRWDNATYQNYDPYEYFYKDYGFNQSHHIDVSGGGKSVTYFLSGGYYQQGNQWRYGDEQFDRYTLNSNISADLASWLNLSVLSKYTRLSTDMPHVYPLIGDYYHDIPRRWPNNPPFDENGNYFVNTLALMAEGGRDLANQNQLQNTFSIEAEPLAGWKISGSFSLRYNFDNYSDHHKTVKRYFVDGTEYNEGYSVPNWINLANSNTLYHTENIYSSFEKQVGKHYFKVMGGFQAELNQYEYVSTRANELVSDNVPFVSTATGVINTSGSKYHWGTVGFFDRINYNYDEKYLIEFSSRYDGSSRFEDGKRWGFFPSVSVGYNIAKENFWESMQQHVSSLKLRFSYGSLGNQVTGSNYYAYLSGLSINNQLNHIIGNERPIYLTAPGLVSSDVTWEMVSTRNFGLDAEAFQGRLSLTFDLYKRFTDRMLGPGESYPSLLGTSAPLRNNAKMESKGFEMTIGWRDRVGGVSYQIGGMLSDNLSKITAYKNDSGILTSHYSGKTLNEIWGLTTVGIFQSDEEIAAAANQSYYFSTWVPGDVHYKDINGDGRINIGANTLSDHGDKTIIGNSTPRYSYGLNLGAEWKGLYVDMFWQGVAKRDVFMDSNFFWGVTGNINQATIFEEHMDYWREDNTDAYFPRPIMTGQSAKNRQVQTRYLQDASYLRLKNMRVGYNFSKNVAGKIGLGDLQVYLTGENLLTFSDILGVFDPEGDVAGQYGNGKTYPLAKMMSFGLKVGLK
ncbi:SusC/RagA family TonB-linked outer membrane protein [Parapedobacter deserti]|uniref:SusC/RagA family TonB-linked outer membrane protein n=1 Tax=Parapedobacter deserti TaxID=1912957 RepID=A0ABV7JNK1_9SPHI